MPHYQLSQTSGADMESRFYVDGRRVSRATFESIRGWAERLECFQTKGKQMRDGRIRRTNYSVAVCSRKVI